jgi:FSR family fosmidomycin resistance protein-like MFS transporter
VAAAETVFDENSPEMGRKETQAVRRREIEVIALIGFGHGVSHFFHLLIPPLFPWLMADFGLTFTDVGATTALFFLVSGVGQAVSGFLVDHLGARRVLFVGIALFAVAAVTLGAANSYPMLMLAAAIAGLGNCVFHPADFTLLNRNISSNRLGHAFSTHGLCGNLGWALAPVLMSGLAVAFGWRIAAFGASGVALLALAILFLRRSTLREARLAPEPATAGKAPSMFAFLYSPAVWMCFLFFFLTTTAFGALQNFAPSALQQLYGFSIAGGASALTAFLLGGAAGIFVGGFLASGSDTHDRFIAIGLAAAATIALAIAVGVPSWSVLPLMAAGGFSSGLAGPSRDMLVRRAATAQFGERAFGRVYGFVYSGLDTGLAVAPLVFGPLMDIGRFAWIFGGVAVAQCLAITTALRVGRKIAATE